MWHVRCSSVQSSTAHPALDGMRLVLVPPWRCRHCQHRRRSYLGIISTVYIVRTTGKTVSAQRNDARAYGVTDLVQWCSLHKLEGGGVYLTGFVIKLPQHLGLLPTFLLQTHTQKQREWCRLTDIRMRNSAPTNKSNAPNFHPTRRKIFDKSVRFTVRTGTNVVPKYVRLLSL